MSTLSLDYCIFVCVISFKKNSDLTYYLNFLQVKNSSEKTVRKRTQWNPIVFIVKIFTVHTLVFMLIFVIPTTEVTFEFISPVLFSKVFNSLITYFLTLNHKIPKSIRYVAQMERFSLRKVTEATLEILYYFSTEGETSTCF